MAMMLEENAVMEDWKNFPLARIPWIPIKMSHLKLEEINYFKKVMSTREPGKFGVAPKLYKLLNELFPYYLPKRYHTMDCVALEGSFGEEQMSNATYFFFCSYIHSDLTWIIQRHLDESQPTFEPLIHPFIRASMFDNEQPELCESAADFLLEPWVLGQLTFQPALLLQWLVAALAEYTKMHTEIAVFLHLPVREDIALFQSISSFLNWLDRLGKCICSGFTVLQYLNGKTFTRGMFETFHGTVIGMLPFLKFILSKEAYDVIRAAKRAFWNQTEFFKGADFKHLLPFYQSTHFVYSCRYWSATSNHENLYFLGQPYKRRVPPRAAEVDRFPTWVAQVKLAHDRNANWTAIRQFVNENIVQPGWIQGVRPNDVLRLVKGDMLILYHYVEYMKYKEFSSSSPGIRDSDTGALFTIYALQADFELAHAVAAMIERAFFLAHKHFKGAVLQAANCEGPEVSLEDTRAAISKFKTKGNFKKLLKQLKDEIVGISPSLDAPAEPCPGLNTMELKEIIARFEARIKRIMFNIINVHFQSVAAKEVKICTDAAFVQYVLPSFVASFLKMVKYPEIMMDVKTKYLGFVHQLIRTFENSKSLMTPLNHDDAFDSSMKASAYRDTFIRFMKKNQKVEMLSSVINFQCIEILNDIVTECGVGGMLTYSSSNFFQFHDNVVKILRGEYGSELKREKQGVLFQSWTTWISNYLARIQHSVHETRNIVAEIRTPVHLRLTLMHSLCDLLAKFIVFRKTWQEGVVLTLHNVALERVCNAMLVMKKKATVKEGLNESLITEAKGLSDQQLLAIVFYHFYNWSALQNLSFYSQSERDRIRPPLEIDKIEVAFHSLLCRDIWRLKLTTSEWLVNDKNVNFDLSLATSEVVKLAPFCYSVALAELNQEGKVEMKYPGEITFHPILHCRWCGQVDGEMSSIKICRECDQNTEYPDKNYFCSLECEDEALKNLHTEEHTRYMMMKLKLVELY